jgi:hypothetical protein
MFTVESMVSFYMTETPDVIPTLSLIPIGINYGDGHVVMVYPKAFYQPSVLNKRIAMQFIIGCINVVY